MRVPRKKKLPAKLFFLFQFSPFSRRFVVEEIGSSSNLAIKSQLSYVINLASDSHLNVKRMSPGRQ